MDVKGYYERQGDDGELTAREVRLNVLDVSKAGTANRCPNTMGYKFLYGIIGDTIFEVMIDGRIRKEHLPLLQMFDVVAFTYALTPNVIEVNGVRADKIVKLPIINPGINTVQWISALGS